MGWKAKMAEWAADIIVPRIYRDHQNAVAVQDRILKQLIAKATPTLFGREHDFKGSNHTKTFA
jgi:uncharacterized lipoprotein YddW (UPF0748 family)